MRIKPAHHLVDPALSIFNAVMEAMQPSENLGGPDSDEYMDLMRSIAAEANQRIANYGDALIGGMETFGFEHEGTWITNPTASDCGRFTVSPEVYGFSVIGTGGGCTAWKKDMPGYPGAYIMLTDLLGASRVLGEAGSPYLLGIEREGQPLAMWTLEVGVAYSVEDAPRVERVEA